VCKSSPVQRPAQAHVQARLLLVGLRCQLTAGGVVKADQKIRAMNV
jgi:hypothetical protein